jgi:hypothetical protein
MVKIEGITAHDVECEERIFDKYRTINNKGICTKCRATNNLDVLNEGFPTSLFVVGKNFRLQNPRILFVGKTLRGGWEENEDGTDNKIYDNNGKEFLIDITKDNHEEISFKGFKHVDDILIKCFKKYNWETIKEFFENRQYPKEDISYICGMLNNSGYKKNEKRYDEMATKEFLREFNVKDIEDYLFKCPGERISRGSSHPFAQSIKYVLECVYDIDDADELWRRTAITNIVKCSVSPDYDDTTDNMAMNCIYNAGFIKSEIEIIKPTHIVLFTAEGNYIEYLKKLRFENFNYEQINEKRKKIGIHSGKEIGTEQQPEVIWWYRVFFDEKNNVKIHLLVTRHPQGASNEWKEEIAEWIKDTNENSDIKTLKLKYE